MVAQQVVAALGDRGVLGLSPQTFMLMTAMMIGAGVDYGVFLFSRYHECVRGGLNSDDAVVAALGSIGKVIAGSAGTVAVTFLGLAFTKLGVFSTVGPALSVTVGVGFAASVTLLPAMITLAGRRGWVRPRKNLTGRWWRRSGVHIVRRPVVHLAASLVILLALAGCTALIKFNYDDRLNLPADAHSNLGYAALDKHFPVSSTVQQFLLIQSSQDLRAPKALADMEEMAQRVSRLPDIAMVRGITRPTGEMLEQARATWQAGEVGSKLRDASTQIQDNDANLNMLGGGAHKLADTLGQLRDGAVRAIVTVRPLAQALADMQQKFGGSKTLDEIDKSARLVANMRSLGEALGINLSRISDVYEWAMPMITVLNGSPVCNLNPACVSSRAGLQRVIDAKDDGTLDKIAELGRQLQATEGTQTLDESVRGLDTSMDQAIDAARQLGLDDPNSIQQQLASAEEGANLLADSSQQLAEGVQLLVDQTKTMGGGLDQASAFLLAMKRDAADPPMSGFYIPPEVVTQDEFKKAATLFVSPDGHMVRYLVQTALNPFSTESMDQVNEILKAAKSAQPNTSLADAKISMVGFSAGQNEIRTYYNADIQFIAIVTLVVVFLILVALLRSLVAPIYLVGSVILSYLSALGIAVIFFQFILGQKIAWSAPGMTFLVLVAVGADYNLLLISRIRDEAGRGVRAGVIRTIGATGGVITSAGLIFAASMFGLTFSSIVGVVQMGFIIGVGLLLDTFLVRTITVPAIAVLLGKANWWPAKVPFTTRHPGKHRQNVALEPIADVNGEVVGHVNGGVVGQVNGGVVGHVNGEVVGHVNGGVVGHVNGGVVGHVNGGAVGHVNGEVVVHVNGGAVGHVNGGVPFTTRHPGKLRQKVALEPIDDVNGGAVRHVNGKGTEHVNGGVVEHVNGGVVEHVNGGAVEHVNGGAVEHVNGGAVEHVNGGAVEHVNGGAVEHVNGEVVEHVNGGVPFTTHHPGKHWQNVAFEPIADVNGGAVRHVNGAGTEHVNGAGTEHVNGEGTEHVNGEGTEHVNGAGTEHVNGEGTEHVNGEGTEHVNGGVVGHVNGGVVFTTHHPGKHRPKVALEPIADVNGGAVRHVNGEGTEPINIGSVGHVNGGVPFTTHHPGKHRQEVALEPIADVNGGAVRHVNGEGTEPINIGVVGHGNGGAVEHGNCEGTGHVNGRVVEHGNGRAVGHVNGGVPFTTHHPGKHRHEVALEPIADVNGEGTEPINIGVLGHVNGAVPFTTHHPGKHRQNVAFEPIAGVNGGAVGPVNGVGTEHVNGEGAEHVNGEATLGVVAFK
jgi:putative drug exporter of the RND superfamily